MIEMLATSPPSRPMSGRSGLASTSDRLVRLFLADIGVLKGLTWRRLAYTVLVAGGFALVGTLGIWIVAKSGWKPRPGMWDLQEFQWLIDFRLFVLMFVSQMLALTIADNLRVSLIPKWVVLTVALVVGTAAGSVIVMTTGPYLVSPPVWGLTWGGLLALVYFHRRRAEELAVALHAAQLARVDLQKRTLESHLQVLQAQVEPQFLFDTLRRVGDLYETDRLLADQMLDNLILYLRAALPQMRTSASTLGQEVQLAQAYLNIERIQLHGRLDFAFDVPEGLGAAPFPPMVLLPLIEALSLREPRGTGDSELLRAKVRDGDGMLILTLLHTGGPRHATDEIGRIRDRLVALYGTEGKLEITPLTPRGTVATLELPYVAA